MHKTISIDFVLAISAMIATIGFELIMAQELQFVLDKSSLQAVVFMLPLW